MKLAVYGNIRCGKSTVCDFIMEQYECEKIEFSDSLQDIVNILYPEKIGTKDRELLIGIGQHLRKFDKNIWVNIVKRKILNSNKNNIIVCGLRQKNEYDMLKSLGFTFIEVKSKEENRIKRCTDYGDKFNKESLNDDTERHMNDFKCDFLIINDKSIDDLKKATDIVLKEIKQREMKDMFFKDNIKDFYERNKLYE